MRRGWLVGLLLLQLDCAWQRGALELNVKLAYFTFATMFVGFNLTFFPMHVLGLHGTTRRIYTYGAHTGFGSLSLTATIGAFVLGLGVLLFLIAGNIENVLFLSLLAHALARGRS